MNLTRAKVTGQLVMGGASFDGALNAALLQIGGFLAMGSLAQNKTSFKEVNLTGAKVTGNISMIGAIFDGALNTALLQVDGTLGMSSDDQNKASFKGVNLTGAKVAGHIVMTGASFDGALEAAFLQVGGTLGMASKAPNKASFKGVDLTSAKVAGDISMTGASFEGTLIASSLEVGGDLSMQSDADNRTSFKNVNLNGAKITGDVYMNDASFKEVNLFGAKVAKNITMIGAGIDGALTAGLLQVDGNLFMGSLPEHKASFKRVILTGAKVAGNIYMRDAHCADDVDMGLAHVGGNLDLRGANLAGFLLSGTSIGGSLRLGQSQESNVWTGVLNLRDAHIGNLADAKEGAWPAQGQLQLDGFTFDHLSGFEGDSGPKMRARGMKWWDNWARLDPDYSPTPYARLSAEFTKSGDRDAADDIRYLGRVRGRETETGLAYVWSGFLQYVAGFGIGTYTFRVLWWVLGFSFAGAALLWWTVPAARTWEKGPIKGLLWCFGASLSRLLPVIEINKEFTEFFNDPRRERLNWLQSILFSALGIVGFVLGAILIAAVSGLTHG